MTVFFCAALLTKVRAPLLFVFCKEVHVCMILSAELEQNVSSIPSKKTCVKFSITVYGMSYAGKMFWRPQAA